MKLLDLASFKKIAQDEHTATMKHKDGHTMTILMSALPALHREQLKRIKLEGGGDPAAPMVPSDNDDQDSSAPAGGMAAAQELADQPMSTQPLPGNLDSPMGAAEAPSQAVQMSGKAADLQTQIDSAAAQGQLAIKQQAERNAQDIMARQNASMAEMKQHTDEFADAMRKYPQNYNPYWNSMSDGQKMGTALGLMLGGLGGADNPASQYVNKMIDNSIEAQKESPKSIYAAYQHLYQNENVSTALTKVSLNDALIAKSEQMTAMLGTPQAYKNNLSLKAATLKENADLLQKAAFIRNAPMGGGAPAAPSVPTSLETGAGTGQVPSGKASSEFEPMLSPAAPQRMRYLSAAAASGDPIAAAQLPRIQEQYARAQKMDESSARVLPLYDELEKNAGSTGGWVSRQIGDIGGGGEGIVGTAAGLAGRFAGDLTSQWQDKLGQVHDQIYPDREPKNKNEAGMNRSYNIAAQELSEQLRSIFPLIGGGELNSKLSGILPENGDTAEQIRAKKRAFIALTRTGEFNMLKDNGMLR